MVKRVVLAAGLALALSACQDGQYASSTKHLSPIPPATVTAMAAKGMSKEAPILLRSFKKESELEVWKQGRDGRYALLKTFPICRWSGQLGPKIKEGDRQAPEGFYTITPAQMNPNSSYYLSFDTGFPNAYDRAHGRSGAHLMVHGSCSSRGCFAMTDEAIAEVYAIGREAFGGGQRSFQFQSFPFRMTAENLAKYRHDQHMPFWLNLKEGYDHFEVTGEEPKIAVCGGRYVFGAGEGCSAQAPEAVAEKRREDEAEVAALVAKGTPAVKIVYEDGGGHQSFRETMVASAGGERGDFPILSTRPRRNLGDVSRPDALAMGPREIPVEEAPGKAAKPTALAYAPAAKPEGKAVAEAGVTAAPKTLPRTLVAEEPKPARTVVASADPEAPVPAPAAPAPTVDSKSLYRRMVGLLGNDPEPAPAPARTASVVEPEKPSPASLAPVPRKRPEPMAAAPTTPATVATLKALKPVAPTEKPTAGKEAAAERPQAEAPAEKRADASGFQQGPRPDLTKPSSFAPAY